VFNLCFICGSLTFFGFAEKFVTKEKASRPSNLTTQVPGIDQVGGLNRAPFGSPGLLDIHDEGTTN
jgi:hypothetical protein